MSNRESAHHPPVFGFQDLSGSVDKQIMRTSLAEKTLMWACAPLLYFAFMWQGSLIVAGRRYFVLIDDAMISMRYARNLAEGHGLVWNASQTPIEGYSNLLWTLVMACAHGLVSDEARVSTLVMGAGFGVLLLLGWLFRMLLQELKVRDRGTLIACLALLVFYYPLVYWTLRGMETGLVVLWVYLALWAALRFESTAQNRHALLLGVCVAAAYLTRMDAVLPTGLLAAYALSSLELRGGLRDLRIAQKNLLALLFLALPLLLCLTAHLAFRIQMYGDWLPNTYYLKVVGVDLGERVALGVTTLASTFQWHLGAPLIAWLLLAGMARSIRRSELLLVALFALQCVYSVWAGGDYAEGQVHGANRFICVGVPALLMALALRVESLRAQRQALGRTPLQMPAVLAGGVGLLLLLNVSGYVEHFGRGDVLLRADFWRARVGLAIRDLTHADAVIASHSAGQIPYFAHRTTIDLLGKNDAEVARGAPAAAFRPGHNKWNYALSIGARRPDLIADRWGVLEEYLAKHAQEYVKLNLPGISRPVYLRQDSEKIRWSKHARL